MTSRVCACACACALLLLIVVLAVQQAVPAVTGPGQRTQTHRALDAGLVPGALVHAQQEAVGNGSLAACTQLAPPSSEVRTCGVHTQQVGSGGVGRQQGDQPDPLTSALTDVVASEFLKLQKKAPDFIVSGF